MQVDVMFDRAHAAVTRPAMLIVVPYNIVVGWIRVGTEIPLDKAARFICGKAEEVVEPVPVARVETDRILYFGPSHASSVVKRKDVEPVHVARVETDRMSCFGPGVTELKEIIGHLRRSSHLASPLQP